MKSIDGRALAATIRTELKKDIAASGLHPRLGVLLVGNDPASDIYVSLKEKAAADVGITTDIRRLKTATTSELVEQIQAWNTDPAITGILVQLPLPDGIDPAVVIEAMDPTKDADGFHPSNVEALLAGNGRIIPPLHEGILRLIGAPGTTVNAAHATIIANSEEFSKPLKHLLTKAGAFVTVMNPDELDRETLAHANIVVIAIGRAGFLRRGMVSAGTCIIDVGTNKTDDGKTIGDVDSESLLSLDGYLSPVPGGVGPMTIAMLLKNVFHLSSSSSS